jgi:hypothetical protein
LPPAISRKWLTGSAWAESLANFINLSSINLKAEVKFYIKTNLIVKMLKDLYFEPISYSNGSARLRTQAGRPGMKKTGRPGSTPVPVGRQENRRKGIQRGQGRPQTLKED